MCVSQHTELLWITVGLWVLAACVGRSTRSKGSQQTLRLSHPVRVARKQGKGRLFAFQGRLVGGRGKLVGQAQEAPPGAPDPAIRENWRGRPFSDPPRRPRVPGFCQPGAPDPPAGTPQTPQTHPKNQSEEFGVLLYCLTARGQERGWVTTVLVYREALPSLTVLMGRSAGGLGRSLERPCKWSAALSAV